MAFNKLAAAAIVALFAAGGFLLIYSDQSHSAGETSGMCGNTLEWTFDTESGELTITGTGGMWTFYESDVRWGGHVDEIKTVSLSDGITSLSQNCFKDCKALTSISIPTTLTNIHQSAFQGCASLKSIDVEEGNTTYTSENGVLYSKSKATLYKYPAAKTDTQYTIPDTVKKIMQHAMQLCTNLTSVTIPDSVTSIEYYAFSGCTSLTSIVVGDGNSEYSSNGAALLNKDGTKLYAWPGSQAEYTVPDGITTIDMYAFHGCSKLVSVILPNTVTTLQDHAFEECAGLTSITMNGVDTIKGYVFQGCTSLESVNVPQAKNINSYSFTDCPALKSIDVGTENQSYSSVDGVLFNKNKTDLLCYPAGKTDAAYEIPGTVTTISNYAFDQCTHLESITITDTVTGMGYGVFHECTALKSFTMPSAITVIGSSMFSGCTALESVTMKGPITAIYGNAFSNCISLEPFTIPDTVTEISDWAFSGCTGLTSVDIPDSVTTMGRNVFQGCSSLESVTIGKGVSSIGVRLFYGCAALESIEVDAENNSFSSENGVLYNKDKTAILCYPLGKTATAYDIPASVTKIGDNAFYQCTSLESVTIPGSVTEIGANAFYQCTSLESVTIPGTVTTVGDHAFYQCTSLESVTIPGSVQCIEKYAFCECTSLESVNIGSGVTTISNYSFYGCSALESVTIPGTVTTIDGYAFAKCSALESVTIPDTVTSAGTSAFYGCTSLQSATIGAGIATIKESMFQNCVNLSKVVIPSTVAQIENYAFEGITFYKNGQPTTDVNDLKGHTWVGSGTDARMDQLDSGYAITFDAGEGWSTSYLMVTVGGKLPSLPDAYLEDKKNFGWFTEPDGGTQVTTDTVFDKAATVYVSWATGPWTVTFDTQGHGGPVAPVTVPDGETVSKPADPTATGYMFGGWFKEAACTTAWDFGKDTVSSNITLYAKWTEVPAGKVVVTFDANGHGTAPQAVVVDKGSKVDEPPAPTADGYTFKGWYKEAACTTAWDFGKDTVSDNITLYAKWTSNSSGGISPVVFAAIGIVAILAVAGAFFYMKTKKS